MPREADTVVIGGGTAGAVVAGLLAAQSDERVVVLEAGPGLRPVRRQPLAEDLLDARALGYTHDWNYASGDTYPNRVVNFERAKVIGGCSAHNGCAAIWGSRVDYDGWADMGLTGWSSAELLPVFARAAERLRVRRYARHEVTPVSASMSRRGAGAGIPLTDDLNDFDQDEGMATSPVNILTARAGMPPSPISIRSGSDRTSPSPAGQRPIASSSSTGWRPASITSGPTVPAKISAARFVVAGGAYGSPAILLRSGIGDPAELREVGIEPAIPLPGVGRNLHDHPSVRLHVSLVPRGWRRR